MVRSTDQPMLGEDCCSSGYIIITCTVDFVSTLCSGTGGFQTDAEWCDAPGVQRLGSVDSDHTGYPQPRLPELDLDSELSDDVMQPCVRFSSLANSPDVRSAEWNIPCGPRWTMVHDRHLHISTNQYLQCLIKHRYTVFLTIGVYG